MQYNSRSTMEGTLMSNTTRGRQWVVALIVAALLAAVPGTLYARDPGFNQPGAAGNVGRDPGINQPGAAGNVGAPGADPGINQPGPAGNRRGIRR
jgi:hypothetical protein